MKELTEIEKAELESLFYSLPKKQQTLEMCEVAVERDKEALKYVSKRFLTEELCARAIKSDFNAFFLIGKNEMTSKLLLLFFKQLNEERIHYSDYGKKVKKRFEKFKDVNFEDFITKEIAVEMVKHNGKCIRYLPQELKTDLEIVDIATETNGSAIMWISKEEQTKELIVKAVKKGASISFLNQELVDDEVADLLVMEDGHNLICLPGDKQTYERCLLAIEVGLDIEWIPTKFRTQELLDKFIEKRPLKIEKLPSQFITRQMLLNMAEQTPKHLHLANPNKEILDVDFVKELVNKGASLEPKWMTDFQTEETVEIALKKDARNIEYVKPNLITYKWIKQILSNAPDLIDLIAKRKLSEEICYEAVLNGATLESKRVMQFQSERIINHLIDEQFFARGYFIESDIRRLISRVKEEFQTKEFFQKILKSNKWALIGAPEEVVDEGLCYEAACYGLGLNHDYMQKHQSQRIADKVFELNKDFYPYVKDEFKTEQMSLEAFEYKTMLVTYMPEEFQTKEMWIQCFEDKKNGYYEWKEILEEGMKRISDEFCTDDLFFILLKNNWRRIEYIPKQYRTPNLMMYVVEQDERAIEYFAE